MAWLDCDDLETAMHSLAAVLVVDVGDLRDALHGYDATRLDDYSEDPLQRIPRELAAALGRDISAVAVDGAYYFHVTRARDPTQFHREGLLPLDQMAERIWPMLYALVAADCDADEWDAFHRSIESDGGGHDGELYRLKTRGRRLFGPYAMLVRELLLDPAATSSHDYLGCPEIVQDIARCFESVYEIDLEARFCAATRPVIVKFKSRDVWPGAPAAALWYMFAKLRDGRLTANASGGFDGDGKPVPPEDIVCVDVVDGR